MEPKNKLAPPLNSADARHLINQWSSHGFFRVRGLGGKITVEDIVPCSSYTVRLRSQYEDRKVSAKTVPYTGGAVDDWGQAPSAWDLPVAKPTDFEERTEELPVPHTDRVRNCERCHSRGRMTCAQCQGFGKVKCPSCNGSGYRTRTEMRNAQDSFGNTVMQPVQVRENCTCFSGKVGCTACGGQGTVVCGDCKGSGRVKTFEQLTVRFRVDSQVEVIHATKIPDKLLQQVHGETLVDDRATPAATCPTIEPRVDEHTAKLLKKAQAVPEGQTRLLFQDLHIEYVGIQEVRYRYRNSSPKSLWIYGSEQQIYAPGVPRPWGRFAAILLGCALLIGILVAVVASLH
ncbi:MAG TPA: hypothetical protein VH592_16430 [Gemmataceae bacterium]|jgi:hypothetical protein